MGEESNLQTTGSEEIAEIAAIALEAVPYAGGVLSGTASYFIEKRKNKRLNKFLIDLADDLTSLEQEINQNFVKTGEFEDLCEDIFSRASENRQQEKLDSFRSLFVSTLLDDKPNYDNVSEIAQLVDSWQSRHIKILRILNSPIEIDKSLGTPVGKGGGFTTSINSLLLKLLPEWSAEEIDRTWTDLYDAKVINTPSTRGMMTDRGILQLEDRLTEYGKIIIHSIIR